MSAAPQPHYQVGGALQAGALYVERAADRELIQTLKQDDFCYVLGPRQIGKSSLRLRAVAGLREVGVRSVAIDLSAIGIEVTQDDWYFSIAFEIAEGLGLPEPDVFWHKHRQLSAVHRWYRWIRNELLALTRDPIVVFIDEVDSVLALSFPTDDFFASIRAAYNLRADDAAYQRLSFCLTTSKHPAVTHADETHAAGVEPGNAIPFHDIGTVQWAIRSAAGKAATDDRCRRWHANARCRDESGIRRQWRIAHVGRNTGDGHIRGRHGIVDDSHRVGSTINPVFCNRGRSV